MNDETLANSAPRSKSSPLPTKKNGMKMPRVTASRRSSWRSSCPEVMPRITPTVNAARIVSRPSWLATPATTAIRAKSPRTPIWALVPSSRWIASVTPPELGAVGEREEDQRREQHEQAQVEDLGRLRPRARRSRRTRAGSTAPNSAIAAAAITCWPQSVSVSRASLSGTMMMLSEVATKMIATSSGS